MTCKDCAHYEACKKLLLSAYPDVTEAEIKQTENNQTECDNFKDKTRFLNIGDKIYQHDSEKIYESTIKNIIYETTGITFDERAIGETVFLTREEAEEKLNEKS